MSEKRFVVENGNNEVSIKDKVEDNYPFVLAYEHIDDADNLIQECLFLVGLLNEQQKAIRKQDIEIQSLNLHIEKLVDGDEISQLLMREYEISDALEKENKQLKQELRGMDELLKSYRETIKHDAELLADATRNGYLPPLDDFVKG